MAQMNEQWLVARRPRGAVKDVNFKWVERPVPDLTEGQILVRNIYLSLDPTNRIWMAMDSYMPAVPIGGVMRGISIGVVEQSRNSGFHEGDVVQGLGGWQQYYAGDASGWAKLPRIPGVPLTAYFGAMGHIGFTAYFGLTDVAQAKSGETLVVTAAAGAVGSIAGQIGKILGCRVVGIAGSDEKCQWITRELGFDGAINYKKEDVREALKRECPNGVDVDFESVGGPVFDAILQQLNIGARVALCGLISQYNAEGPAQGPANLAMLIARRARIQGFLVMDYAARFAEASAKIVPWLKEGKLKYRLDVVEGLREAPAALNKLFDGTNTGKMIVRVSEEPA